MYRLGLIAFVAATAVLLPARAGDRKDPVVVMETSLGKITIELFETKAPITVKNFLRYVDEKHYDGTLVHRVVPDFIIAGGGFDASFKEKKTHEPIKNEAGNGIANKRGTLAMARTDLPDSATAEFFINVKDNDVLNRANARDKAGYAVFGQVIDGLDVIDRIRGVNTGSRGSHKDVPVDDVVIKSVRRAAR